MAAFAPCSVFYVPQDLIRLPGSQATRMGTTVTNIIELHIIIISAIVSPLQGEGPPKLVPFTSVLCRSHPCHASKLHNFISPSSFLSSLTSRTCHWSPFCCYLCPTVVVLSSGKMSRPSPFLDFNLFYDILDISLLSDPLASFSVSLPVIPSIHLTMLLCIVLCFCSIFFSLPKSLYHMS